MPEQAAEWPGEVKYEIDTPDFWEEIRHAPGLGAVGSGVTDNTPLTGDERETIAVQVREVRLHLKETRELTAEQFTAIERRLEDMAEASQRVGRKDWAMMLLGAGFSMIPTGH